MTKESVTANDESPPHPVRNVCETILSLLIAIVFVRSLIVEGYLITTGSMAPNYYGEHKRAICPSCDTEFAVGIEFDDKFDSGMPEWSFCPNCLRDDIDLSQESRSRGDHLLVWKNAYLFRDPRRWEVIVFRNPNSPMETFLKRVVGLPGESVQILQGNLFVNGRLERKALETQQGLALLVFDQSNAPTGDEEWTERWRANREDSGWKFDNGAWSFTPQQRGEEDALEYHHTLRVGGTHVTRVPLAKPLSAAQREAFESRNETFPFSPEPPFPGVRYDPESNELVARGVVTSRVRLDLLKIDQTDSFREGVESVCRLSRFAPVRDDEAYNAYSMTQGENPISEFLFSCRIRSTSGDGSVTISLSVPEAEYSLRLDFEQEKAFLSSSGIQTEARGGVIQRSEHGDYTVQFSSIDRQILVSINGDEPFAPVLLPELLEHVSMPTRVVSIHDATTPLRVSQICLKRDVYYTPGESRNGVKTPYQLSEDEYFVLGDNSAVSSDSRNWQQPGVPQHLIVGKPVIVHLPSKAVKSQWGEKEFRFRVPDFDRIRFVR